MKFVDEATIRVEAGNGGNGGSVYLRGTDDLNTLADFRHTRVFRAQPGAKGVGRNCTGRSGDDRTIPVPLGTRVADAGTGELIGELTRDGQALLVARGGNGGLGNTRFKSSTNRAPRKTTPGTPGEQRELGLELQVLADVGLLGLPNAGKSTFLLAVSEARPKVADYPFTTLHPHLGVVRVEEHRSFVAADIPGLIEGAAEGAGLGIQFLRHLSRTNILLHLVDMAPLEPDADPAAGVKAIESELKKFSDVQGRTSVAGGGAPALAKRERWLVLNKMDLVPGEERETQAKRLIKKLKWKGPVYRISAINREGCRELVMDLMRRLEQLQKKTGKTDRKSTRLNSSHGYT